MPLGEGWGDLDSADSVDIWPENIPIWDIFGEVCQQWRLSPTGSIIGLDLAAVLPYLQVISDDKALQRCYWRDLCHIASGVIQAQQDNTRE